MDPRELSDRAEITDLITRYTRALDQRRWDTDFDGLFTPDAHIDYTGMGGAAGDLEATKRFLTETMMPVFSKTQHMLGLPAITIDGDRAEATTPCHNPMKIGAGKEAKIIVCSLWYHHELARTDAGWRIARLWEERNFMTMLARGEMGAP